MSVDDRHTLGFVFVLPLCMWTRWTQESGQAFITAYGTLMVWIRFITLWNTHRYYWSNVSKMAVCWVILRRQQIYTVIHAVHSLLYIVAKCNFFSVVTWKYLIKCLRKCEGCTHFCEILYTHSVVAKCIRTPDRSENIDYCPYSFLSLLFST